MADPKQTQQFVDAFWEDAIVPTITDYIKIPNVSSMFDPNWQDNGHVERAVELVQGWIEEHKPQGPQGPEGPEGPDKTTLQIGRLDGRTPLLLLDVPGQSDDTILMYGHLDKQPEMTGWRDGLGAWKPVRDGDKLYGRGGADDGYAVFASICSLLALRKQGIGHARVVILIEFSEESGSPDLPAYVEHFAKEIGTPSLIVCLDSGAGNYEQLWSTTSLRGLIGATLRVDVLDEGVHSGDASGIVASSFRILRELVSRLEDPTSGTILPPALSVDIPEQRRAQAAKVAEVLGDDVVSKFPWCGDMRAVGDDPTELVLNRTWRPALAVTGQEGMPALNDAGNVLRPYTTLSLSLRIPPTLDPNRAKSVLEELLTKDPPYGAKITLDFHEPAPGWNAPALAPWLNEALDEASKTFYGKPALHMGEGGSIPFMGMLGEKFPEAQFVITGVLGPQSNAHGPNEFLHIDYAKKLTACIAEVIERHHTR